MHNNHASHGAAVHMAAHQHHDRNSMCTSNLAVFQMLAAAQSLKRLRYGASSCVKSKAETGENWLLLPPWL